MPTEKSESAASASSAPYVPAQTSLPEITVKAVCLAVVLSVLLAAANAYLGLLVGMTVSASIPAAVASLALLRLFKRSNVLENNVVQTSASAGESVAAGAIFTFPALIMMGVWSGFDYWKTTFIALLGGFIGVLFTVPLRHVLIVRSPLKYPEGLATAEVLKAGDRGGDGVKQLAAGGLVGAGFKFCHLGLGLWPAAIEGARRVGGSVAYMGANLLPALVGIGYIVGFNIAVLMFIGGALNWFVAIPVYAAMNPWPDDRGALDYAWWIWSNKTRYLGVGAMLVGGVWTLVRLSGPLAQSVRASLRAYAEARSGRADARARTERDMPMTWVLWLLAASTVPLWLLFAQATESLWVGGAMAAIMLVADFLFSAVASYMAGLVGSSNNPVSGVTIATILTSALLLLAMLGGDSEAGPAAAILIGAVVCCAAAIGGDNMQDLKAGHILGATPNRQQIMQLVGVVAAAAFMAPILSLLLKAYGFGADGELPAPQAALMASVAEGVFSRDLPWGFVTIGMALAACVIALDCYLERRGGEFRTPVLAVAVGVYLPLELETAMLAGGLIAWAAARRCRARTLEGARPATGRGALLLAAGLITGEALAGIGLAVPIVLAGGDNPLSLGWETGVWGGLAGLALLSWVVRWLYRTAVTAPDETAAG